MNGSEDGFGLGRRALGGRRSARMNLRPSMMNDSANGDGGEDGRSEKRLFSFLQINITADLPMKSTN